MTDDGAIHAVDPDPRIPGDRRVGPQDEPVTGADGVHVLRTVPEDGAVDRGEEVIRVVRR